MENTPVIDLELASMLIIIVIIVFLVVIPLINIVLPLFTLGKCDQRNGDEVVVTGRNQNILRKVLMNQNRVVLVANSNINHIDVDVIFYAGSKKKKASYHVEFNDDTAIIDAPMAIDNVAIIVTSADGVVVSKKKRGYPNEAVNIIASVSIAIGVIATVILSSVANSHNLNDYSSEYGIYFYVLPIIIGVVLAIAHYFVVKLITKSFNKGGKR